MDRRRFLSSGISIFTISPLILNFIGCKVKKGEIKKPKKYLENPKIEKLNLAIEHEFGAIVQYINHAGITENKHFYKVIPQIIFQEVQHAILISNIIRQFGYLPTLSVWPPQTGKNFKENLIKDIEAEKNAIKLYEEILKLGLTRKNKEIIEKILKTEEGHLKIFKKIKHEII